MMYIHKQRIIFNGDVDFKCSSAVQCVSNIDKGNDLVKKCLLRHPISKNLCTPQHAHYPARVDLNAITKQKAYDLHNYVILPTTSARSQISLLRHRFITT